MTDLTTSDTKGRLWQMVLTINKTCREGKGFDKLGRYFHDDVVVIPPGFRARAEGKDTCLKHYEDACSQMTFEKLEASDEQIDVRGSTAIVTYKYDCTWEFQGKRLEDDGHEILVCTQDGQDWKIAWRTLIPGSREVQTCPAEEAQANQTPGMDIREECLLLMETSPVCQLTTIDSDGFPHTTAMNNLRHKKLYPNLVELFQDQDNDLVVYLSTSRQSAKMARMVANPKVSVYFCNPDQFHGLMLGGTIEIITDQASKNRIWQEGWTLYYPNGPEGPEYGVIRLRPTIAKGWSKDGPFGLEVRGTS